MKTEEWERIETVLHTVAELPPAERAAYLEQACGDDSALLREVETLLAADEDAGSFLNEPLSPRGLEERFIGPYKVLWPLGEGGMGTVYLAVRADDQYRKRVALKVFQRDTSRKDLVRRFRAERQILAFLEHPNIAKMYDGGTTEEGQPYFVMEYVEGLPIDQYCDRHELSVEDRIRLFRIVCSAVHCAHQNLVIHRDIKPNNVLVTADGTVQLLDFGIAKLLDPEHFPQTVEATATGLRLMTPHYASPEQVRGERITTASDLYSLGVLLYKLLTGRLPYRFKSQRLQDVERAVCEEEPESPSSAISREEEAPGSDEDSAPISAASVSRARGTRPRDLRRQLTGDLENILLKALRKSPERRYESVVQLSEDLRRFLEGLPVRARKATMIYRVRKFVRRNRLSVALAGAFLGLIFAFSGALVLQAHRVAAERDKARNERDKAQLERDKAQKVTDFMTGIFRSANLRETPGEEIYVHTLLEEGARRAEYELRDQPEVQTILMDTIGNAFISLNHYEKAEDVLNKALGIRQRVFGEEHPLVAESFDSLAGWLQDQGKYGEAEVFARKALEMRLQIWGEEHLAVAESLNNLALLLNYKAEYGKAEPLYEQALEMLRRLRGETHPDVAEALNNLGLLHYNRGNSDVAESLYHQALEMWRQVRGEVHLDVAMSLNNLALLHHNRGEYLKAEFYYREALEIQRTIVGEVHRDVALQLNNLAVLSRQKGDYRQAEKLYQELLEIQRELFGEKHPLVALILNNLGTLARAQGDYRAAESLFRRALEMRQEFLDPGHFEIAHSLEDLGSVYEKQGQIAAAEDYYHQALTINREALGEDHLFTTYSLVRLGSLLTSKGDLQEAEPLLRQALTARRKLLAEDDWRVAWAENSLGACLGRAGEYEEAEPLLVESLPLIEQAPGVPDDEKRLARTRVVDFYHAWRKPGIAAEYEVP